MFLSEKGNLMLLLCTKENIKIHHKLVTGVTSPAFFFFMFFQGIHWFTCVCITDRHAKEKNIFQNGQFDLQH